jgi:hypothetical protein
MNIWGKLGKEYYSWHIENINELEAFIIKHNINVDYIEEECTELFEKFWYNLKHQIIYWDNYWDNYSIDDIMHITLMSQVGNNYLYYNFTAIKAAIV